ncbi:dihydroorotase [Amylibacter sp. IMCC11727]|uniref:dihydroorotase n=1 Tax=Amylibacter sp. IMCC11727 TaxID=3039851 RepID=UPI00244E59C9|nr:dihydroorotase [Amylibacter sp. IMCC11727]WGI22742.1 dihydroorotase [Amylibacter sp. IMCC11727]
MTVLLTNARLIDPENGERFGSVLIEDGQIARVFSDVDALPKAAEVIDCAGKCLAPGIIDIGVKVCEPGERHKESFRTAGDAAAAGGVTTMVVRPDTEPAVDSPETLQFAARRAADVCKVKVLPMAALTKDRAGQEMAEIGFLMDAGAVAFTDCDFVNRNNKIFGRCLSYAQMMGAVVIGHAQEPVMSDGACATSGPFASKLGLPAVSVMAERMQLERDMAMVEMTGVTYHLDQLSAAVSLPVLERAKAAGLPVTAGVSIHHLTLNELDIDGYRTFFKVKPPLRPEEDRVAMADAVGAGLIDIISSMHTPQDEESKRLPFEEAASGAVGLETLLPAAMSLVHAGHMDLATLWKALSLNPAKLLGLDGGRLAEGAPADLVVFDPDKPFVMDRFALKSRCKNTPFDERRMQGAVLRTFVNGDQVYARD